MKTINVVAAIIIKDNKVLATQRGYGEFKGGWEFPGGKIEEGESPEEALIREIKEELELNIEVNQLLEIIEYDYPKFHLSMKCYLCSIIKGSIVLNEHQDAKWLDKKHINDVEWLAADVIIINRIVDSNIRFQ